MKNLIRDSNVDFSSLTFIYTNKCNSQCPHCCLDCGPDKQDKMSPEFLKNILRSLPDLNIPEFCISGGEPLLYLEEIEDIMALAKSLGLNSQLGTNGFWGVTYDKSYAILERLHSSGLKVLLLSTDKYHQEFVSVDNIYNIVKAAEAIGIKTKITVNMTGKETENLELIDRFEEFNCLLSFKEPKLIGRARQNVNAEDLSSVSAEDKTTYANIMGKNVHSPCNQVVAPLVTPDKRVWICCGLPSNIHYYSDFNLNPLVLGKIEDKTLAEILAENEDNFILKVLLRSGPMGLVKIYEEYSGEKYRFRDRYYWACELCCDILGDQQYLDQIEQAAAAFRNQTTMEN